jgi:uncharacterized protein YecA (UPF0149 family)
VKANPVGGIDSITISVMFQLIYHARLKDEMEAICTEQNSTDNGFDDAGFFVPNKPIVKSGPIVGRNDPCSCGSGKKYKNCCLDMANGGTSSR